MVIDQRNSGAAVTVNGFAVYPVDRFFGSFRTSTGTATAQQVSDAPTGFVNSLRMTQASVTSPAASDIYSVIQRIEGFNTADLNWGSANAKTVTLSFWVKSSVTGTYGLALQNINASRRAYVTTYTVSSANTWEYKTITVVGDTSGTWETTSNTGIAVLWDLGSGSDYQTPTLNSWQTANVFQANTGTRWIATSGATWQITGVQLEVGSSATSFETRSIGTELNLCLRYCVLYINGTGESIGTASAWTTSSFWIQGRTPLPMRTAPSATITTATNAYAVYFAGSQYFNDTLEFTWTSNGNGNNQGFLLFRGTGWSGTVSAGLAGGAAANTSAAKITLSAEL